MENSEIPRYLSKQVHDDYKEEKEYMKNMRSFINKNKDEDYEDRYMEYKACKNYIEEKDEEIKVTEQYNYVYIEHAKTMFDECKAAKDSGDLELFNSLCDYAEIEEIIHTSNGCCSDIMIKILDLYADTNCKNYLDCLGYGEFNSIFHAAIIGFDLKLIKYLYPKVNDANSGLLDNWATALTTCHNKHDVIGMLDLTYTLTGKNIDFYELVDDTYGYFCNHTCNILGIAIQLGLLDVVKWMYDRCIENHGEEKTRDSFGDLDYLKLSCIFPYWKRAKSLDIAEFLLSLRETPLTQDEKNEFMQSSILNSYTAIHLEWMKNLGCDLMSKYAIECFSHVCRMERGGRCNKSVNNKMSATEQYIIFTEGKILDLFPFDQLKVMVFGDLLVRYQKRVFLMGSECPYDHHSSRLIKTHKLGDFHLYGEIFKFLN